MSNDKEKDFKQIESMSKEEAVQEIKRFFKGNKKFIAQATLLIYSSHHFEKIDTMKIILDNWNWEKFLALTIKTKSGFKQFYYRKGNKKYEYTAEKEANGQSYNKTSEIEDFRLKIYDTENQNNEEFTFI